MDKIKIQITYNGKLYEFDDGLKSYIFHLGLQFDHCKDNGINSLLSYVNLVSNCVYADTNSTVIADLAAFVTMHWKTVANMDKYNLLELYYNNTI